MFQLFPDPFQPTGQLFLVDIPITQTGGIIRPMAEPTVVDHQQLDSGIRRLPPQPQELFPVKVEIRRFPAVDQRIPVLFLPANQVLSKEVMIGAAHAAQTRIGTNQNRFRGLEAFSGVQPPAKTVWMDSQYCPNFPAGIHFRLRQKVPGINEAHAVDQSLLLRRRMLGKREKRVVLVGGNPTL